jgi:hypothetical protein
MEYKKVESSMIDLVGYDADSEVLEVRFLSSGYTYVYEDVPPMVYKNLMNASSKGSEMREIIDLYGGYKLKGKSPVYPKKSPMDKYKGNYMIIDMPDFDDDYLSMEEPPFMTIEKDGSGEFQFGLVSGQFSETKITLKNNVECFQFKWSGNDENDEASGWGFCSLNQERSGLTGEISFNDGDDHYFYAEREERNDW